ncbi:trans-aconitate 2-methyltransferase [Phenylobacterium sp.]|uniref:class I SAM-dependent methyltransferase n=1 Tax=Phenylobacterium sp. TaxID=1871053 RepID=UPI0025E9DEBA|nr:class I SAM-dependent methyltransferase [Phenylobacterium sp.]MBX3484067.1 class I SAM-dependent methyltransferase [Phenylobacterium sp.]MCW5758684.1 class I SAM-dependent methyltransferase [Phenylobacterium sp.]
MQFADLKPAYQGFVRDRLRRAGFQPETFHLDIPPQDEMFNRGVLPGYPGRPGAAVYRYIESALRTFDVYGRLAESIGGFGQIRRALDFGSGYGRLTRALVHRVEPRRIWACDIYAEAVAWQAETFGVNGLVSVSDPDRFALEQEHEVVFAASVFSHLPDGLFQRWLARLYDLVSPEGLLAFSVHDASFAPGDQPIGAAGIGYGLWSESQTLDPAIYGMSYVTVEYVTAAIASACGDDAARNLRRYPRALFESQDLYVVPKARLGAQSHDITIVPIGGFVGQPPADCWVGWGLDSNTGCQIVRAELFVDGRPVASAVPTPDNHAVMKYFPGAPNIAVAWAFPRIDVGADTPLRVDLISSSGTIGHCYALAGAMADGGLVRS